METCPKVRQGTDAPLERRVAVNPQVLRKKERETDPSITYTDTNNLEHSTNNPINLVNLASPAPSHLLRGGADTPDQPQSEDLPPGSQLGVLRSCGGSDRWMEAWDEEDRGGREAKQRQKKMRFVGGGGEVEEKD